VSKSAAHVATKLLKLEPYRTTVVHQLLPPDAEARINYCRWFQKSVYDGMFDPDFVFYTDEAYFISAVKLTARTIVTGVQKIHTPHRENRGVVCYQCAYYNRASVPSRDYKF
jgi:hypothetical protein